MKNSILLIVVIITGLLTSSGLFAQAPKLLNYQGIAREASGNPMSNQQISLRISILNGSAFGTAQYVESHDVTTNDFGLYNVAIGDGAILNGAMSGVDWSVADKYIKVEIDPTGGTSYLDLATSQLLSVPYALYAKESGSAEPHGPAGGDLSGTYPNPSIANNVVTADKLDQMGAASDQVLTWNGTEWTPNDLEGGFFTIKGNTIIYSDTTNFGKDFLVNTYEINHDTGTESKMMFIPSKGGAFRAGRIDNESWDTDSIGISSFATGQRTIALGNFSTAMGSTSKASGNYSIALGLGTKSSEMGSAAIGINTIASGTGSAAIGGYSEASGIYSTTLGLSTIASGSHSIATGRDSKATGATSTAIGHQSKASGSISTAMGFSTVASGENSTAMGTSTTASGDYSTTMGRSTTASGDNSTALGFSTKASGYSSTAIGRGTTASGQYSTAMGYSSEALAKSSTVIGANITLSSSANGSIYLADESRSTKDTRNGVNTFYSRFDNGYQFFTSGTTDVGVSITSGGNSWSTISDSTKKENYLEADGKSFLDKIGQMKLGSWNYKGQDKSEYRHYGPMAQEFYTLFGNDGIGRVGNDTTIATADIDGVMMIAIQALIKENEELKQKNEALKNKQVSIESELSELQKSQEKTDALLLEIKAALNEQKSIDQESLDKFSENIN